MIEIQIHDWELNALIGVHPHERTQKQPVVANLDIEYDGSRASQTDRIEDALDYEDLCIRIGKLVSNNDFFLLEKLAARIGEEVFRDKRVERVRIALFKPSALRDTARVSVVFDRRR